MTYCKILLSSFSMDEIRKSLGDTHKNLGGFYSLSQVSLISPYVIEKTKLEIVRMYALQKGTMELQSVGDRLYSKKDV